MIDFVRGGIPAMKKLLLSLALPALVIAPLVAAAQTSTTPAPRSKSSSSDSARPAWKNDANLVESRDIIGMRIRNEQGKDVGAVDNLLFDPQSGKISQVVIGLGGVLGVGEKKVVVPFSELKVAMATDGKRPTATMDQARLEAAPRYERTATAGSSPSASPKSKY